MSSLRHDEFQSPVTYGWEACGAGWECLNLTGDGVHLHSHRENQGERRGKRKRGLSCLK